MKNALPKITVVTVTYNAGKYLEKTINSVISQNYQNLEYIIVDGGSTDTTLSIIKKYESKISFWISEKDDGIYDAMNKGVSFASGDWVNYMNAGDSFVDSRVISDIFSSRLEADLIYGDSFFCDAFGKGRLIKAKGIETLWAALNFNHNSLFAKKDCLVEFPFDISYKIVADSKFVINCFMSGKKLLYVDIPVNNYLTGGYSDSNTVMRTVERWKLVSDYQLSSNEKIYNHYFRRLKYDNFYVDKWLIIEKNKISKLAAFFISIVLRVDNFLTPLKK